MKSLDGKIDKKLTNGACLKKYKAYTTLKPYILIPSCDKPLPSNLITVMDYTPSPTPELEPMQVPPVTPELVEFWTQYPITLDRPVDHLSILKQLQFEDWKEKATRIIKTLRTGKSEDHKFRALLDLEDHLQYYPIFRRCTRSALTALSQEISVRGGHIPLSTLRLWMTAAKRARIIFERHRYTWDGILAQTTVGRLARMKKADFVQFCQENAV